MNHYVYMARCGDYVKIGIARDYTRRLRELQQSLPIDLDIICTICCPNRDVARNLEICWHRFFEYCNTRGEWFEFDTFGEYIVKRILANFNTVESLYDFFKKADELMPRKPRAVDKNNMAQFIRSL